MSLRTLTHSTRPMTSTTPPHREGKLTPSGRQLLGGPHPRDGSAESALHDSQGLSPNAFRPFEACSTTKGDVQVRGGMRMPRRPGLSSVRRSTLTQVKAPCGQRGSSMMDAALTSPQTSGSRPSHT